VRVKQAEGFLSGREVLGHSSQSAESDKQHLANGVDDFVSLPWVREAFQ
jgi:hypothetical protein